MWARIASLCLILAAGPLAARDILLNPPIVCDLSEDCYIQQYVDHDPSTGATDYTCGPLSYDTHTGTDFALRSLAQMERGIVVIPAAPGTVHAIRDGMPDVLHTPDRAADIDGRACGNGIVIDHGGGWSTQYCHLRQGSIAVEKGDRVRLTTKLGQVGLSGRTQFPHVHMIVRKTGAVVDPFDPKGDITCGEPSAETLWQTAPTYRPGGILTVGFADAIPEFNAIKAGQAAQSTLSVTAPALVVFADLFGGRDGDTLTLDITGPDGLFMSEKIQLTRTQARLFRAIGRRNPATLTAGDYTGTATLVRGGTFIEVRAGQVTLR